MKSLAEGSRVLVVGMGISGLSALRLLNSKSMVVDCYDAKKELSIDTSDMKLINRSFFGEEVEDVSVYSAAVVAPGVPLDIPLIKKIRGEGLELIGEVELAYTYAVGSFIGITGTNGKTTTTTWTHDVFVRAGKNAHLAGNVGIPLCDVVREHDAEDSIYITELSSYQLESIVNFKCESALILNITPDHLQRHGTMENYAKQKYRISENMEDNSRYVLNYDDEILRREIERLGNTCTISLNSKNCDIYVSNDKIYAKKDRFVHLLSSEDVEIIDCDKIFLKGAHNLQNACGMVALALLSQLPLSAIRASLMEFKGVAHRNEFVLTNKGIDFYNDSKATNPEASIPALRAMTKPYVLIAGGMDKGSNYTPWIAEFHNMKRLILFGETKFDIAAAMDLAGRDDYEIVENLDEAFSRAMSIAEVGDAVLLSPACASWDMYPSFEVRGDHFKSLCHKLEQ